MLRSKSVHPGVRDEALAAVALPAAALIALVRGAVTDGGSVWIRVTGNSMAPLIREGDGVLVVEQTALPRVGEVIFVDSNEVPLLHRVARCDGELLVTRGDVCRVSDPAVETKARVALAVAVRRGRRIVALRPTLRFGVQALIWFFLWWARLRVIRSMRRRLRLRSRAVRAERA